MDHRHPLLSLILFLMSFILFSQDGFAYYYIVDENKPRLNQRNLFAGNNQGCTKSYALYDSFIDENNSNQTKPTVYLKNCNLTPFDEIDLNYSIRSVARDAISVNFSLSNQIYANIKLRKLVDEYDALQKQSAEALHSYELKSWGMEAPINNTINNPLFDFSKKKQVNRDIQSLIKSKGMTIDPVYISSSQNNSENRILSADIRRNESLSIAKTSKIRTNRINPLASRGQSVRKNSGPSNGSAPDPNHNEQGKNGDRPLPWISQVILGSFKLILGSFKYIMENKVEALLYAFLIILAKSFFSAGKSRR